MCLYSVKSPDTGVLAVARVRSEKVSTEKGNT